MADPSVVLLSAGISAFVAFIVAWLSQRGENKRADNRLAAERESRREEREEARRKHWRDKRLEACIKILTASESVHETAQSAVSHHRQGRDMDPLRVGEEVNRQSRAFRQAVTLAQLISPSEELDQLTRETARVGQTLMTLLVEDLLRQKPDPLPDRPTQEQVVAARREVEEASADWIQARGEFIRALGAQIQADD